MNRNQIIAIAVVAVVAIAGISVVAFNMTKKSGGHDLVFANGNKDCYEPTWIADQLGYYKEFGADVEMMTVTGGGKALEALQSGRADIAGFGSTPLANALNKNADDNIVVLGRWMGGKNYSEIATIVTNDGKVYDFNHPKIADTENIEVTFFNGTKKTVETKPFEGSGVKIGMDTSTGYWAAISNYSKVAGLTVAKQGDAGYDSADIKVVHVEFGNQVAALEKGDVDAIMGGSYDLAAYATIKNCVLSSPSDDVFPTLVSEATCVLAATKEAYAEKYDQIVGVLKALQKASCYIYGIDYVDGIYLTDASIKEKQAALSDVKKEELFGKNATPSLNGFYYSKDACKRIADFFGSPFTEDVQKLSYDKYIWGIDFELVDMQIVEATYNDSGTTGTNPFRTLTSMDYMNYFDGRALYDAMKDKDGNSAWNVAGWYADAAIYFSTLYDDEITFTINGDYKLSWTVEGQNWRIYVMNADGKPAADGITISNVTMSGNVIDFDYDELTSTLFIMPVVTGNIEITAS